MNEPPAGLTVVDWAEIRALYERHRHSVSREEDGSYVARNPEQRWRIRFDGRGFTVRPDEGDWSWGLELVGFGGAGALEAIEGKATATGEGTRVSYRWSAGLEEWFVNDKKGLEQGWTVRERPAGGERLELALRVRGGLKPEAEADGAALRFVDDAGVAVVRYERLQAWDATGRTLPSRMAVDKVGGVRIEVDDRGAHYPVTIDPVAVQTAYIKASNTGAGDAFRSSVALFGDTLAVGAYSEDSNGDGVTPTPRLITRLPTAAQPTGSDSGWSRFEHLRRGRAIVAADLSDSRHQDPDGLVPRRWQLLAKLGYDPLAGLRLLAQPRRQLADVRQRKRIVLGDDPGRVSVVRDRGNSLGVSYLAAVRPTPAAGYTRSNVSASASGKRQPLKATTSQNARTGVSVDRAPFRKRFRSGSARYLRRPRGS